MRIVEGEDASRAEDNPDVSVKNDVLADYDEWDSLSKMATMAFFDKNFGVKISLKEIGELKTVKDLLNLAKL